MSGILTFFFHGFCRKVGDWGRELSTSHVKHIQKPLFHSFRPKENWPTPPRIFLPYPWIFPLLLFDLLYCTVQYTAQNYRSP